MWTNTPTVDKQNLLDSVSLYTKASEPKVRYFYTNFRPLTLNFWIKFMVDMIQIM